MLVLDTNHISVLGYARPESARLVERLDAAADEVVTTVISLEEQMRGWLAEINRDPNVHRQIAAYDRLRARVEFMAGWVMLPWDQRAADLFLDLRRSGIRVGTLDLKIACITIVREATLLTRNLTDFRGLPGLRVENWLD